ncbi:MAG: alkaline phosphatase [Leeuwenhoekiella sp.]|nr:MAG: alkaline phosphatase [Leeuwenhoekiella sp.]
MITLKFIFVKKLFFLCVLFVFSGSYAQRKTPYQVHAHNDYAQEFPFWGAYVGGAASIEADVFLKENMLYVTHSEAEILPENTLERLYLQPLADLAHTGDLRKLQLLIDIKSEAKPTLKALVKLLENYPTLMQSENLEFVISGNRPQPEDYGKYPHFIQFDHQNTDDLKSIDLSNVALVSVNFKNYSVWNGLGRMVAADLQRVEAVINTAHANGKPVRFWASPDTKTAWATLANLGVDYINTDTPARATDFLSQLKRNTYTNTEQIDVYKPAFDFDYNARPENVILLIGDGNGLTQITSAQIANGGELSLTQLTDIGFSKTASADDLVTDSAAGGTAMATGHKTHNRAIGVDSYDQPLQNITEILSLQGFNTGLMSTDAIDGATPASFYAHRAERDDSEGILADLKGSRLNFFIAGGKSKADRISSAFTIKSLDSFTDLTEKTAVFLGESKVPSIAAGRGELFPNSLTHALSVLNAAEKPFFLMAEAAQIDSNGHTNNAAGIIQEMLDFDVAIARALQFADTHKNTLVVITADHETSGFGIMGGDLDQKTVRGDFLSTDHSGVMVPVFAYGPGAQLFRGVYENTEIFKRILKALQL